MVDLFGQVESMFAWLKEIIHSLLFALSAFFRQETRYELSKRVVRTERLIGEGGFSYVYLVRDVADHKLFALKAIRAQTEEQLQKAMEEASIHSQLRHPNLLRLEDSAVISDVHIRTNEAPYKLVLLLFPFYSVRSM